MSCDWTSRARRVAAGEPLTREEALELLAAGPEELPDLIAAAAWLRRQAFGMSVKVNYLVNLRSGLCPEDCGYCSQRLGSEADVLKYSWLTTEQATAQATAGVLGGARRVCLVASGRGPSRRDVDRVVAMTEAIKGHDQQIEVCACLGFVDETQAARLKEAGVDAYNHNLNTSQENYSEICSTHTYEDRVKTVSASRAVGLSPCSGLIIGMGESDEGLVDTVMDLVRLEVDSIPVNFLMPFEGTPMEGRWELTPSRCLQVLALARFLAPRTEIRIAGGREMHLRSQQPTALLIANSLFLGDYLTSQGQAARADLEMLRDGGFTRTPGGTVEDWDELIARHDEAEAARSGAPGADEEATGPSAPAGTTGTTPCGSSCPRPEDRNPEGAPVNLRIPAVRRRGAGTAVAPNA